MNQKKFVNIVVIIGIVVLAGIAGYFVVNYQTPSSISTSDSTPTPPVSPTQTPILPILSSGETAGWKVYEDTVFGFRLRYPTNLILSTPYKSNSLIPPEQLNWTIGVPVDYGAYIQWRVYDLDSKNGQDVMTDYKNPESKIMKVGNNQVAILPDVGSMHRSFSYVILDQNNNKAMLFIYSGQEDEDKIFHTILGSFESFTSTADLNFKTRGVCDAGFKLPSKQVITDCASLTSQGLCEQLDIYTNRDQSIKYPDGFRDCVWHIYYDYLER